MSGSNMSVPVPSNARKSEREVFKRLENILKSRKPYCSGTMTVNKDQLIIFYGRDENSAGRICLDDASPEQLERLVRACDPATFGVNQESVLDEQYRKSKKLDPLQFSSLFDVASLNRLLHEEFIPDRKQGVAIHYVRHKLNVYEPGSFFKPHVDTPRGGNMFGSLVIVFPTAHEGGSLVLRDAGKEWTIDSAHDIASNPDLCVGFIAFYGDVEHEVLPITSGYRVTMTYNLYYDRTSPTIVYVPTSVDDRYDRLKATFEEMLDQPPLLPNGGYLAFALQRKYGMDQKTDLRDLMEDLKGSDDLLLSVCEDMSLRASLRVLYRSPDRASHDVLAPKIYQLEGAHWEDDFCLAEFLESQEYHVNDENRVLRTLRLARDKIRDSTGKPADIWVKWVVKDDERRDTSPIRLRQSTEMNQH
ncbi:hypothetical protein QCA50_015348 [Cerrena zonata]|uniref:Fe2OG dioxygenase domain-containing protein n=1 Tax=Cerrena zonata TaxID=2478898 RepID=A0AAW0FJK0_9APHY